MKKRLTPEEFAKLARAIPRDERVPFAFEKRVMARLGSEAPADVLAFWARGLWRAAAACLAVMGCCAALSWAAVENEAVAEMDGMDLEMEVLAPANADLDLEA